MTYCCSTYNKHNDFECTRQDKVGSCSYRGVNYKKVCFRRKTKFLLEI